MHLLIPLLPFALTGFGLVAAIVLFLSVKREVRAQSRRHREQMEHALEQIKKAEPPAAQPEAPEPLPPAPRSGMNLSKRVQAMRLHRRGEDVSHIAAALGVPRGEIELLIRVQKFSAQRAAKSAAAR